MAVLMMERSAKMDIWQAYRTAFEDFSRQVRTVQILASQAGHDPAALDAAMVDLEKARLCYDDCRNALALSLLPASALGLAADGSADSPETRAARVKRIAQLLWDFSGRPEGAADEEWHRAEEIVRRSPLIRRCA
jgi:hypothetical protein